MRLGQGLILCAISLLVIGVVMVTSAGLTVDAAGSLAGAGSNPSLGSSPGQAATPVARPISLEGILLGRHATFAALALVALAIGTRLPVERLFTLRGGASPIPWLVVGMVLLLLAVHVPGLGREMNGAKRWVQIGPLSAQPSELAKWMLPVVVAWHCCRHADALSSFRRGFLPPIAVAAVICALIGMEDLGTAVLVFAVCVAMLVAAGCRIWHVALLAAPAAAGVAALIVTSPYRVNRILAYLNPYADPSGIGYHIIQSIAAVAGGGLSGRGLGNSVQKFGYLPEDTTDFIFAIICEELGMAGALVVVALYAALVLAGLAIVRRATTPFTRLLALGFVLTVGFQAVMNLAVVTGLAPTKGIALPLLSRGGTGWVFTALAIGMLVSIDRRSTQEREPVDEPHADRPAALALLPAASGAAS